VVRGDHADPGDAGAGAFVRDDHCQTGEERIAGVPHETVESSLELTSEAVLACPGDQIAEALRLARGGGDAQEEIGVSWNDAIDPGQDVGEDMDGVIAGFGDGLRVLDDAPDEPVVGVEAASGGKGRSWDGG